MVDVFTKAKRSEVMSRIQSRNTTPERIVRSALHSMGYRFRLHSNSLVGRPDVVLPRHRMAIFVHGCFWHRHKGCQFAYSPKTRREFWKLKFDSNIARDKKVRRQLTEDGWRVVTIWECATKKKETLTRVLRRDVVRLLSPAKNRTLKV